MRRVILFLTLSAPAMAQPVAPAAQPGGRCVPNAMLDQMEAYGAGQPFGVVAPLMGAFREIGRAGARCELPAPQATAPVARPSPTALPGPALQDPAPQDPAPGTAKP